MKDVAAAIIITLVGLLLIGFQQYRYVDLQGDLKIETQSKDDAVKANSESQATITTLRAEAKRNDDYLKDLRGRLKTSEDKARRARKNFEDLKTKSPAVRNWANQPLPDGLRGKPAASGSKDNGSKTRTP